MPSARIVHVFTDEVSVVIAQRGAALPAICHWGERIDVADDAVLASLADAVLSRPGAVILPEHAEGWGGRPGLSVHRAGVAWTPAFEVDSLSLGGETLAPETVVQKRVAGPEKGLVALHAVDRWAGIDLELEIDLTPEGLLRTRTVVRNESAGAEPLDVLEVSPLLAVPTRATEILDFVGRWAFERAPQRHPVAMGIHARESRRGRTGLDATGVIAVGEPGFSGPGGDVWLLHVGFSGNHVHAVERTDGTLALRGGEVLLPGEVRLATGDTYRTPWVYGSFGDGLDAASSRFHRHVRGLNRAARRPRPVTLNIWEAVYFDLRPDDLIELATAAAEVGVERFVVDDGWFLGRRDDHRGLGDWIVDPEIWPDGMGPLADHVRATGMEFGLWVEPEMINPDSDLARAHPDWILRARPELPPEARFQQVLDLTNPEAFAHILEALDGLVRDLGVAYLKWDHNRDLVAAGHPHTGTPAVHEQTWALYRLLDELRERHPDLEIESCASGGGRVDLGVLARTDRVHTSDNHDALDRARILRWTGLLVPPEMLGSHVASSPSHATGRHHDLHTRCAIAFLGHFGFELDVRAVSDEERAQLQHWVTLYRRFRGLIQQGRVVTDDGLASLRGVVAPDASDALYSIVTPPHSADTSARVRLTGLSPRRSYRIEAALPSWLGPSDYRPAWVDAAPALGSDTAAGPVFSGSALAAVGLEIPLFAPDRALLVRATAVGVDA